MQTGEQIKPFFMELHKQQEDAVSAISKLERIADAVFGPAPTLRAAFPRLSATASRWVCRKWKPSIRRAAESVKGTANFA